jgi:putative redox protein
VKIIKMRGSNIMSNILNVSLHSLDDKAMLNVEVRDNPNLVIDYFPPVGTGKGYTSMELLMASFGSCVSTTLLSLLRYKMHKNISSISVNIQGIVRSEHPRSLEKMSAVLDIVSNDVSKQEAYQALKVAEENVCPVWAMLKGNVDIDVTINVSR